MSSDRHDAIAYEMMAAVMTFNMVTVPRCATLPLACG